MGFNLIETDWTALGSRLASNMINAIYVVPTIVAPMQLHRAGVNHMLDLPIAPVMGAIVMNRVTWNKLSAAHQREIIRYTQRMAVDFDASMMRAETNAISAMDRDGLTINRPSQEQQNLWFSDLQTSLPSLLGTVIDRDLYNQINQILERARGEQ
jgi:TRAP-type C4-dicarboxylate transport system substrate-binding protein